VTVLFADIRDSTRHIEHLDPEAAMKFLDDGVKLMTDAVHRLGGTICSVSGDGIFALFGAPKSQEHHAVLGCYAGLEIQERARAYPAWASAVRVGINSGEVVVAFVDVDYSLELSAAGAPVHLASRIEALCRPGAVYIGEATYQLASEFVEAHSLGKISIRGIEEKVGCYELTARAAPRSPWESRLSVGLTPFVDRAEELQTANRLVKQAKSGRGQVIALVGEPGTGKSRLAYELVRSDKLKTWLILATGAFTFNVGTTYFAVATLLQHLFEIGEDDPSSEVINKLRRGLDGFGMLSPEKVSPVAALLNIPSKDETWENAEPHERRERMIEIFVELMLRVAQDRPLTLVFEDLQWADDETKMILDRLIGDLANQRILLILTYRPELTHNWAVWPHFRELPINPLNEESAAQLTDALIGDHESLRNLKRLLADRTGGIPFFIEESVRALSSAGLLVGTQGKHRLDCEIDHLTIPANVQAVIASRIDRLAPEEKNVLQMASVIGESSHMPLLLEITGLEEPELNEKITTLANFGFLRTSRLLTGSYVSFGHSLIHDVAYSSILKERRKELHAQLVLIIEVLYSERLSEHIVQLALHAAMGELWQKAAHYYTWAADEAIGRSAYSLAIGFYQSALMSFDQQDQDESIVAKRVDAELNLRRVYGTIGDPSGTLEGLDAVERLAEGLKNKRRLVAVNTLKAIELSHQGETMAAIAAGEKAYRDSASMGDMAIRSSAIASLGVSYYHHGAFAEAVDVLGQIEDYLLRDGRHKRFGASSTMSVRCLGLLVGSLTFLGQFADALKCGEKAYQIAEEVGRPIDLGTVCYFLGFALLHKGDPNAAIGWLERGRNIVHEGDVRYLLPWLESELGLARTLVGNADDGLRLLQGAVEQCDAMGLLYGQARACARSARAHFLLGKLADALNWLNRTLKSSRKYQYQGILIWALQLSGETNAKLGHVAEAAADFDAALALAGQLRSRPDLAHVRLGLGRLDHDQAHLGSAREHFREAMSIYEDLEMPSDVARVRQLIADLGVIRCER
jgi:class 3 adenylate cyclase/tetratricopeptide (TPR) repeat protein